MAKKMTGEVVRKRYQGRLEKTAKYVAKLICNEIDKKINAYSSQDASQHAKFSVFIDKITSGNK